MTDNEIIKALEDMADYNCEHCPFRDEECEDEQCDREIAKYALELINRQKAEIERLKEENDDLAYTIGGVMFSVDKWLDGDELKQHEVIRAATMREKTLQITEKQQAEIERLQEVVTETEKSFNKITEMYNRLSKNYRIAKSEAIKEFAERLKEYELCMFCSFPDKRNLGSEEYIVLSDSIDNLVKEMTEEE